MGGSTTLAVFWLEKQAQEVKMASGSLDWSLGFKALFHPTLGLTYLPNNAFQG